MAEGITGFYTVLDTGREGPEVMMLGELDSIICPAHPDANPVTGAVHSCGHNAQCATLLGIAAALKVPGILDKFCGRIRLCAAPAEELLEIEYRSELKKQGKIKYFGGKSEFLSRGYFDGVDIAFMVHTAGKPYINKVAIGCIAKNIIYKGVAAHAGGAP
jgi:metal-dependent amidase/aminoacylase/carboxypeptidase family protein